jgi:NADPH-dependent ferric siderophore reductase
VQLPAERCHVWIALESQAARALRRYFTTERGVTKDWIKSSAYWQRGAIGKHERIED